MTNIINNLEVVTGLRERDLTNDLLVNLNDLTELNIVDIKRNGSQSIHSVLLPLGVI